MAVINNTHMLIGQTGAIVFAIILVGLSIWNYRISVDQPAGPLGVFSILNVFYSLLVMLMCFMRYKYKEMKENELPPNEPTIDNEFT